jgi:hypothetical protein
LIAPNRSFVLTIGVNIAPMPSLSRQTSPTSQISSNRGTKLLENALTALESATSQFIIDNFCQFAAFGMALRITPSALLPGIVGADLLHWPAAPLRALPKSAHALRRLLWRTPVNRTAKLLEILPTPMESATSQFLIDKNTHFVQLKMLFLVAFSAPACESR